MNTLNEVAPLMLPVYGGICQVRGGTESGLSLGREEECVSLRIGILHLCFAGVVEDATHCKNMNPLIYVEDSSCD